MSKTCLRFVLNIGRDLRPRSSNNSLSFKCIMEIDVVSLNVVSLNVVKSPRARKKRMHRARCLISGSRMGVPKYRSMLSQVKLGKYLSCCQVSERQARRSKMVQSQEDINFFPSFEKE